MSDSLRAGSGALLLLLALPAFAQAAGANGGFVRYGAGRSELRSLCALRVWDGVERVETLLYFSERRLDCAAAAAALEPETALDRALEEAGGAAARLRLVPGDPNFSFSFTRTEPRASFFVSGLGDALAVAKHDPQRIEGRFHRAPDEIAGEMAEIDLRFATALDASPLAGTPLPADGGAPSAAYRAYLAAVAAKDFGTLQRLTTGRAAGRALGGGFAYFQKDEPKSAEILGGEGDAQRATLRVRARTFGGERVSFRVRLEVDDAGKWRLVDRGTTTVHDE